MNVCGIKRRRVGDVVPDKQAATPRSETGCENQLSTYSRHLSHFCLSSSFSHFPPSDFPLSYFPPRSETACEKQPSTYSSHPDLSHCLIGSIITSFWFFSDEGQAKSNLLSITFGGDKILQTHFSITNLPFWVKLNSLANSSARD